VLLKHLLSLDISWNTLETSCYLLKRLKLLILLKHLKWFWKRCRRAQWLTTGVKRASRARRPFQEFQEPSWNVLLKHLLSLDISWNTLETNCYLLKCLKLLILLKRLWFKHDWIWQALPHLAVPFCWAPHYLGFVITQMHGGWRLIAWCCTCCKVLPLRSYTWSKFTNDSYCYPYYCVCYRLFLCFYLLRLWAKHIDFASLLASIQPSRPAWFWCLLRLLFVPVTACLTTL